MTVINGRFPKAEAEQLVTSIFLAKIRFQEDQINTRDDMEEDIKHSEKRIKELTTQLRSITTVIRNTPGSMFDIDANIMVTSVLN